MKRRNKSLITIFVVIPIFYIIILLIGMLFNMIRLAIYVISAIAIFVIVIKICIAVICIYKSYLSK